MCYQKHLMVEVVLILFFVYLRDVCKNIQYLK